MAVWSRRPSGYKLGVLVLIVASLLYLVGFVSPFWVHDAMFPNYHFGLWMYCDKDQSTGGTRCDWFVTPNMSVYWFKAVQMLEWVALTGLYTSCTYAFVFNRSQTLYSHNRFLEILTGLSGMIGFIAVMVFIGYQETAFSWAFGLSLISCILAMVTAIIIFKTNRPDIVTTSSTVVYAGMSPVHGGNMMVLQGQSSPPLQPGMMSGVYSGYAYPQAHSADVQPQCSGNFSPYAPAPAKAGYVPQEYNG